MNTPLSGAPMERDTDADWKEIGRVQPYWGVLTEAKFRPENLNSEHLAAFYHTGVMQVASIAAEFEKLFGTPHHVATALDFGCGAGRVTEAMTAYSDQVVGYDISPGMLQEASANSKGQAIYTDQFPEQKVNWVNSFIVFQHIPPNRGFDLLEKILALLTDDGVVSLYFVIYRDTVLPTQTPAPEDPLGCMQMYDYDLTRIVRMLHRFGIERLTMVHEDHDGHHGVMIYGRRGGL